MYISILVALSSLPSLGYLATYYGKVDRVIDGDTVVINGTKVRLIGIDTPESVHPRKPVQCFAKEASSYAKKRFEGKRVKYVTDEAYPTKDRYGRLLAYIYDYNGQSFFNAQMVKWGYALAYRGHPYKYQTQFIGYESMAKKSKLGLWKHCQK